MYRNYSQYSNQQQEHAFRVIQRDLKGELPPVILLCGKEQFLVDWALKQIISANIEDASRVLDLTVIDQDSEQASGKGNLFTRIIESCETLPLLSKKKIVVVKDEKILDSADRSQSKNSELNQFCDYLETIPTSTILVFASTSVDRKRKIPKAIIKNGKIYDFEQLDRRELISFADKRFRAAGISVPSRTMEFLIDETGYYNKESDYDLFTFSNDITKMIALTEDGVLSERTVKDTVESDIETFIFSLMNSISGGRKDKALELLHNIASDKSDVSLLVSMIVSQFEVMYSIKELMEERVPDRIIVEKLGIKDARLRALKSFVSGYDARKLKKGLEYAYEIDRNIKTGLLKPMLALEMFISNL